MKSQITVGAIVKFETKYYRVTSATKNKVNLGSIFGRSIYHKSVPREQVTEASEEFYSSWRQSETYKSM